MAVEVMKYLSAQDPEENKKMKYDSNVEKETFEMARKHAEKWADDAMNRDKDFCELRVQTLRLDMIYCQYAHGLEYMHTERGKRIGNLLNKYGALIPEQPDPKKYSKMIKNWIVWGESAKKKGLL